MRSVVAVLLVALLGALVTIAPASADGGGDEVIQRPMRFPARAAGAGAGGLWTPARTPSEFEPREFPSVLRDPSLPDEPDGLLWRRMRETRPDFDPLDWAVPSRARWEALAAERAALGRAEPDTFRCLAIRVDFLEDSAGEGSTTPDGRFDLRHPDSARVAVDPPPHNRDYFDAHMEGVARYYYKISGGTLVLDWDIYPTEQDSAYHLSDTADYGPWVLSYGDEDILSKAERLVRDSFAAADSAEDAPDFRSYDSFLLFHSGTDFQGDINRNTPYDIPSFNIQLATGSEIAVQDSTFLIDLILVVPETVSQDGFLGALNGVLTHEYGHQLGFYDMYNVLNFYPMVGMFSIQDSGDQLYGQVWDPYRETEVFVRGAIPASLDPWQKLVFFRDGVNARWIEESGTYELPAVEIQNDLLLVPVGTPDPPVTEDDEPPLHLISSDIFILENRQYDLNGDGTVFLEADSATGVILGPRNVPEDMLAELGFEEPDTLGQYEIDYLLPGGGILIWHLDSQSLADAFNTCYGCVNIFFDRQAVDVEEADGIPDLGDVYSVEWTGGALDYWSQETYSRFAPDTDPNTSAGGGAYTGIAFDVLDSSRVSMRVEIDVGYKRPGWPVFAEAVPGPESIETMDVDGDERPEVFIAGGTRFQIVDANGAVRAAQVDSLLLPGVAVRELFHGADGAEGPLACAATGLRVYGWDPVGGELVVRYPGGAEVFPSLRFTTPPMVLDSVVVIGDSQGRVRGLLPGAAGETRAIWRTAAPGHAVTALAADPVGPGGTSVLAWGTELGEVYLAGGSQRGGYAVLPGWPVRIGEEGWGGIAGLRLIESPDGAVASIVAVAGDGTLGLWGPGGEVLHGWPVALGAPPAGPPAIGDPDADGHLELVCTDVLGEVHVLDLRGRVEAGWPRSVWHPDTARRKRVRSGPILIDLHPAGARDGRPEIVQADGHGALHAMDFHTGEIEGWPRAAGYAVSGGPLVRPLADDGGLQWVAGDIGGYVTVLKSEYAGRSIEPGESWGPHCDGGHTGLYPASLIPEPVGYASLIDAGALLFTPNPVVGDEGLLRVRMGRAGSLTVRLYDTSGHEVWREVFHPEAGEQGDVLALDLRDVAPGLYVAKVIARAENEERSVLRKVAVVR